MANSKKTSFNDEKFCEALHHNRMLQGKQRGSAIIHRNPDADEWPAAKPFVELKHTDLCSAAGKDYRWMERSSKIIVHTSRPPSPTRKCPALLKSALRYGCAIQNWGQYKELPKNIQSISKNPNRHMFALKHHSHRGFPIFSMRWKFV